MSKSKDEKSKINSKYDGNMENSKVISVTDNKQYLDLLKNHKKVIVYYGDPNCDACRKYGYFYKKLANKYYKKAVFIYTDITKCGLSLSSIPAIYSYINGKEFLKLEDGVNTKDIKSMMKTILILKL
jgi:thioredoxin-like negative regulator of GroEL